MAAVAIFAEVYVGREYGRMMALGDILLRGAHMPSGFIGCGSDGNAIGS